MPPVPADQVSPFNGGTQHNPLAHTIADVCAIAKTGRTSVYESIKSGNLKARKLGRKTLILDADLRAWLDNLPTVKNAA